MNVENPRYIRDQGYPTLEVTIDSQITWLHPDPKATLIANGIVVLGSGPTWNFAHLPVIKLPELKHTVHAATRNQDLFRLYLAFGEECGHGRFREGPARTYPDPEEIRALGARLADFHLPSFPTWAELTAWALG
jgi:hypothetical protein